MRLKCYKILLLLITLTCSAASRSQVLISILFGDKLNSDKLLFGLQLDYGFNTISGVSPSDNLSRFNLGLFFCFNLHKKLYLQAEGMAKYGVGAKGLVPYSLGDSALDEKFRNGTMERRMNYLALPLTLQCRIFNYVNIEAGAMAGLCVGAKDIFRVGGEKKKKNEDELTYKKNVRDDIPDIDLNVIAGASYHLGGGTGMKIGARYCFGVADALIHMTGKQYNRSLQVYASIPIGRKKK